MAVRTRAPVAFPGSGLPTVLCLVMIVICVVNIVIVLTSTHDWNVLLWIGCSLAWAGLALRSERLSRRLIALAAQLTLALARANATRNGGLQHAPVEHEQPPDPPTG